MKRICKICGKKFETKSARKHICDDVHYQRCPDCGKLHELKKSCYQTYLKTGPMRCWDCRSKAISNSHKNKSEEDKKSKADKIKATCIKKYGVDNPLKSKVVREKMLRTIQEKYGVESNISQSKEIQEKIRQNSLKRYGVEHPNSAPEVRTRLTQGMIDKYGVDNAGKSSEIQERRRSTILEKYGVDNPAKADIVQEHMKQTCLERYGVPYALQADEIRQRIKETCKQKYGICSAPSGAFFNKLQDEQFKKNYTEFTSNPRQYIELHYGVVDLCKLVKDLNLDFTTVWEYVDSNDLWDIVSKIYSTMETEIYDFIRSLDSSIEIIRNDRKIISPYELDLYLPEYNIGIECNPTFTHNSTFPSFTGTDPIDKNYHKMKSNLAKSKRVFLFHIFGYEWTNKREIMESMIRNLLGKNNQIIYGRKTTIKELSGSDIIVFLNQNHRQGYAPASVRLGLFYNNELVSVMTFSHMRNTIGKSSNSNDTTYELVRFCNKLNTSVIGGASKLFKYFVTNYHPSKIVSFSDIAHTRGSLYNTLGFHRISVSAPNYVWVDIKNDTYLTRLKTQKQNLRKLFQDTTIDIDNLTENQIMSSHGYAQVFDSGTIRWEYTQ